MYREDRLETVRQEYRSLLGDLQGSINESVAELESRIRAIELAQSNVAGQLEIMQESARK